MTRHWLYTAVVDPEGWLTSELAAFACAACGQPYGPAHVRVIAQREGLYFVDLSCPHCASQAVAIVTIQVDGGASDESLEDDATGPARIHPPADGAAASQPALSVDDVIDAHVLLRDFEGDVHQLIARFEGRRP
jgi:hypothetical protein